MAPFLLVILRELSPLALLLVPSISFARAASTQNGEEARWLVRSSGWATLSRLEDDGGPQSSVESIAEFDGRVFLYLMGEDVAFNASLTLSEAQIDPSQYFGAGCGPDGALDPEDPRCAKLTIAGVVSPCDGDSEQPALGALFAAHPQMSYWPEGHGFIPCEMKIKEEDGVWMISNFGGGGFFGAADWRDSDPVHHPARGFGGVRSLEGSSPSSGGASGHGRHNHGGYDHRGRDHGGHDHGGHGHGNGGHGHGGHGHGGEGNGFGGRERDGDGSNSTANSPDLPRPEFGDDAAGHARWIVAKSLWTTISTASSRDEGEPFGNVRSVADGGCLLRSTGLPYFYLPAPDPTAVDVEADPRVALSFTEAALAERVGDDGVPCGGKDAEDPTYAQITLVGRARPLMEDARIGAAEVAFAARHPRAGWLSSGGAHTGGAYYTLDLDEISFLQSYGGYTELSLEQYLNWMPDPSKLLGEADCGALEGRLGDLVMRPQTAVALPPRASASSSSVPIVVFVASFIGSVVAGLAVGRAHCPRHAGLDGYFEASGVDTAISSGLEGGEVDSKAWA